MTNQKQLLLVDDNDDLRELLAEQLATTEEEFSATEADTAGAALAAVKDNPTGFDLLILDVGLPDQDGRELCRRLRRSGVKAPIIMLTAADTDADTILGLEAGANDYVSKPFRFPVLLARIRAQLRQHELSEDAIFALGPYNFKPSAKLLVNKETEQKTRLTEKETAILKYLKRADGRAVSREQLLDEVWGYNAGVNTHTLETHIYRLRQKIEDDPSDPRILVTEGGGYRLGV